MFRYADVAKECESLSSVQLISITRSLLRRDTTLEDDTDLSAGESLLLWLADLLEWMQICGPDQRTLLLQELREEIISTGFVLQNEIEETDCQLPVFHIGFADRRWATCTTRSDFFDLDTGKWVKELEEPPLETVTYAATALFMRKYHQLTHSSSQGRQEDVNNDANK